jgi:heme/copper-type cytochrome/quinol oxidase subunit 2
LVTRLGGAAGLWLAAGDRLAACPVCFRIDDAPTTAGVQAAVTVMMAVTATVLSLCGVFLIRFRQRARRQAGEAKAPAAT